MRHAKMMARISFSLLVCVIATLAVWPAHAQQAETRPLPPKIVRDQLTSGTLTPLKLPRQVQITSRILEWSHDSTLDWGFTVFYEKSPTSPQELTNAYAVFPKQTTIDQGLTVLLDRIRSNSGQWNGVVEALEELGDVEVLSEPKIVVVCVEDYNAKMAPSKEITMQKQLDKRKEPLFPFARVSTSSKIPYETVQPAGNVLAQVTRFKDTSVQLTVGVEKIVRDEYVKMFLDTGVTDLSGYVSVALNEQGDPLPVPQTYTREIRNTVIVRDRTIFLAGILKSTTTFRREQGVPFLSRIPILGYLFKNYQEKKSDRELLFMLRPEIVIN